MAHLLMIESWVGGTGRIFPPAIARLGHRYTFVTRNRGHYQDPRSREIHPVIEHADHVLSFDTNDVPALIEFLRAQHAVLKFDGVVTICDYYIGTVAEVAQALDLPQAFSANVVMERRKDQVREAIGRAGLPNPKFAVTSGWDDTRAQAARIGYPLIAKPTDLASSAFVRLVHDEEELCAAFDALEQFPRNFREQERVPLLLLEEYMRGEEVSVEACTYRGRTTIIGITDKSLTGFPYFIEDGHMFPAKLDGDIAAQIEALVRGALDAVGHDHGISHTEVKLTVDGPRIVEINPRPGGNYIAELIQRVTGIDLLDAQIELALGREPDLRRRDTGVASAAIKFLVPPRAGHVVAMEGAQTLDADLNIERWSMAAVAGTDVAAPIDNACYIGHVIASDGEGQQARDYAERALARVTLTYAEAPAISSAA
ncbi:ATP-grasp domain-containing protein [Lysobacter gummosus]|uniref:ATP-grasp domain-containing protein n=1 Tax=Lysobacter gummosus TaxID=262324 RepID=A0ABY3XBM4_9GAMM|nr:ATP-grasp domain-containing protein [Lysobacter gummosus]ALN89344.1 phosphoribosylglycinamide synthetase, ATP-grasp domain protein [Lysobacter gummosus]UNP30016.1 ATP-grasp domain-containing protein [Lysobacter gummosus]